MNAQLPEKYLAGDRRCSQRMLAEAKEKISLNSCPVSGIEERFSCFSFVPTKGN